MVVEHSELSIFVLVKKDIVLQVSRKIFLVRVTYHFAPLKLEFWIRPCVNSVTFADGLNEGVVFLDLFSFLDVDVW